MATEIQVSQVSALPFTLAMVVPCTLSDIEKVLGHESSMWQVLQDNTWPNVLTLPSLGNSVNRIDVRMERDETVHFLTLEPTDPITIDKVEESIIDRPVLTRRPVSMIPGNEEFALVYAMMNSTEVHFIYNQVSREVQRILVKAVPTEAALPDFDPHQVGHTLSA